MADKPDPSKSEAARAERSRSEQPYDHFVIERVFPKPITILKTVPKSVTEIGKSCVYVLDANAMLAPFAIDIDSFNDVAEILRRLVKGDRLYLPAQAVREYARHRATKLRDVYADLHGKMSNIPAKPVIKIPMFEETDEYKALYKATESVAAAVKDYKDKLKAMVALVQNWNRNDPVSRLYAEIFQEAVIVEHGLKPDELLKDLQDRTTHSTPPGFKDKNKPDGGMGDVAIWHSIISVGKQKKSDVVFVTNEEKADWMVRHADEALFPRFELVDEFYRATGKQFCVVNFTKFVAMNGAKDTTVGEVKSSAMKDQVVSHSLHALLDKSRELTIWGAWHRLIQAIESLAKRNGLEPKQNLPTATMRQCLALGLISKEEFEVYMRLRSLRNALAHGKTMALNHNEVVSSNIDASVLIDCLQSR